MSHVVWIDWRRTPRGKIAHAYRRHRGGVLGPICDTENIVRAVEARRLAHETVLVEEDHRERCLRCMSAVANLSKDESGPDNTVEVFEVFR